MQKKRLINIDNLFCDIHCGDSRDIVANFNESIDLIVTSPPYADARKNHYDGIDPSDFPDWFLSFSKIFWKSLKPTGSFILNIKDRVVNGVKYHFVWKTIDLLEKNGWYCIDDYIWYKTNPMPGYWPTRLRDGWEYCFHLSKTKKPYINQDAVRIPLGDWAKTRLSKLNDNDLQRHNSENKSGFGRDISKWVDRKTVLPSNVLSVPLVGKNKGHPAVFPIELPSFFIKLLSKPGDTILDPFAGSGTTGIAALNLGRNCILIDNKNKYCKLSSERIAKEATLNQFSLNDHLSQNSQFLLE